MTVRVLPVALPRPAALTYAVQVLAVAVVYYLGARAGLLLAESNRIGAGNLNLAIEPVDLVDLVRSTIRDDSELLDGRPVHVVAEGPAVIPADPFRIRQVIENPLSNAVKFSPRGRPIEVRVTGSSSRR